MELKQIRNEEDHAEALSEIELLWGANEGTPQSDRLEFLVTLVEAYERATFPIA
jgi:HTH-type transcriptional regulator/antitoxin HigA